MPVIRSIDGMFNALEANPRAQPEDLHVEQFVSFASRWHDRWAWKAHGTTNLAGNKNHTQWSTPCGM